MAARENPQSPTPDAHAQAPAPAQGRPGQVGNRQRGDGTVETGHNPGQARPPERLRGPAGTPTIPEAAGHWRTDGILFLVSAPSGTGKTTLCESVRKAFSPEYSVSCTTRKPRKGEVDGVHYHFISVTEFAEKVSRGEFLEHAEVHGNFYGTLRQPIVENLDLGRDVLLEIDTEGASQIRHHSDGRVRRALVDIFILPPSLEELRRRLVGRNSESDDQIERRMLNAVTEMRAWREYQYTIVSGSKEEDFDRFRAIYIAQRCVTRRLIPPDGQPGR